MERHYDFLIVGSGIAGLFYALKVVEKIPDARIAIVTKKQATDTNTNRAQGGIAAVLSGTDSFEKHIQDTLKTGCGLSNREVVEQIIEKGPATIEDLIDYGVQFSRRADQYDLGREGGHSANRVLHAADLTGQEIERALLEACHGFEAQIDLFQNHIALELITCDHDGEEVSAGAFVFAESDREFSAFYAPVTMLTTGGIGQVYFHNTNPKIATGDGVAIAYRAGIAVANLEFVQFHPTTLYSPGRWPFLVSEAVRGEGARLLSLDGRRIMKGAHELTDLAPRDIVAREIDKELKRSGEEFVLLDATHLDSDFIKERFPNIYKECARRGLDMTQRPLPVVPAAHYSCGGVICGVDGKTELPGLFVAGEVAMTGMHGANRLASNSLLEAVVMSRFAADRSCKFFKENRMLEGIPIDRPIYSSLKHPREKILIAHDRRQLCRVMSDFVGIVRTRDRLNLALEKVHRIKEGIEQYYLASPATYNIVELRNMATVAELIIRCALMRSESRGLHYLEGFSTDDKYQRDTVIRGKELHSNRD